MPYNIWEVLVKIFFMFPDVYCKKKNNKEYVFVA